jgi:hypothetical protein
MLEHLSPQRAACLVDERRPCSQTALATLLRAVDPVALRDLLARIADDHAFSWDAYSMLGRVAQEVACEAAKPTIETMKAGTWVPQSTFQVKHGTAERWDICDCTDCVAAKLKG